MFCSRKQKEALISIRYQILLVPLGAVIPRQKSVTIWYKIENDRSHGTDCSGMLLLAGSSNGMKLSFGVSNDNCAYK